MIEPCGEGKWDAQTMHLLSFVISARNVAITKNNICLGGGGGGGGRQLWETGPKVSHLEA